MLFHQYYYEDNIKTDTYFRVRVYNGYPYINGLRLGIGDEVRVLTKDVFLKDKYTPITTVIGYNTVLDRWVAKGFEEYDIGSLYCRKGFEK